MKKRQTNQTSTKTPASVSSNAGWISHGFQINGNKAVSGSYSVPLSLPRHMLQDSYSKVYKSLLWLNKKEEDGDQ
ncbi:MAG: hypothetical protein ACOYK8_03815 [Alphaproteobacteria bacterium]